MRAFPKFLKRLPELYGLGLPELIGLVASLNLLMILRPEGSTSAILCLSVMLAIKFLRVRVDFKAFLLPKKKTMLLCDLYQRERR